MNITYLIGNGFDISIGLHTKYEQFYRHLTKKNKFNKDDFDITRNIMNSIENGDDLWSDFELGLGNYVERIKNSERLEQFIEEKFQIENELKSYLKLQEERIEWNLDRAKEAGIEFYKAVKELNYLEDVFEDYDSCSYINSKFDSINVINFNYTNIIERIVENIALDKVLHLHGKLDGNIILGVDNKEQIKNIIYRDNEEMVLSMCKRDMMNHDSKKRLKDVRLLLSEKTDYVFIYGLSVGETDRFWWDVIEDSLKTGNIKKVVIFWYDSNIDLQLRTKVRRKKESVKRKFLKKYYNDENIRNNVEVIINSDIFNSVQEVIKELIDMKEQREQILRSIR